MSEMHVPGTVMPLSDISGGMFSIFRPMIEAADGLSLGQVCAITGLEYSTVQNWVKRGFVDRRKKEILRASALTYSYHQFPAKFNEDR